MTISFRKKQFYILIISCSAAVSFFFSGLAFGDRFRPVVAFGVPRMHESLTPGIYSGEGPGGLGMVSPKAEAVQFPVKEPQSGASRIFGREMADYQKRGELFATGSYWDDNTTTFTAQKKEQKEILDIVSKLKKGYQTFDLPLIEKILADNFRFYYHLNDNTFLVDDKTDYLEARKGWTETVRVRREMNYSIQEMILDPSGKFITVTAFSTYTSKYFSPRFFETLLFEESTGHWTLKQQIVGLLYPNQPDLYHVEIFAQKFLWPRYGSPSLGGIFSRGALVEGPSHVLDHYLRTGYQKVIPREGPEKSVLFIFREPPPVGSVIDIEHQLSGDPSGPLLFQFRYKVEKKDPFFVIENRSKPMMSGGWVTYRVFLNGKKIGEETFDVR
jgi:hypothetical protein